MVDDKVRQYAAALEGVEEDRGPARVGGPSTGVGHGVCCGECILAYNDHSANLDGRVGSLHLPAMGLQGVSESVFRDLRGDGL